MKKKVLLSALLALTGIFIPLFSRADGLAGDVHSLQGVLDNVYKEMLPVSDQLIGVGRGIAGFGALWYIAARVWRHLANAEPVDFYPLLRPFCIGGALILYTVLVIPVLNGVMSPVVTVTSNMVKNSDAAIASLLAQKQAAIEKTDTWQMYVGDSGEGDREKWYVRP